MYSDASKRLFGDCYMKPGDLVKILPRPFLGNRETIGMILKTDFGPEDNLNQTKTKLSLVEVAVQGKITYVAKKYIIPLKRNTHVSKT